MSGLQHRAPQVQKAPAKGVETARRADISSGGDAAHQLRDSSGTPGPLPYLDELEAQLGEDLGALTAVFGAEEALSNLGADAAAVGDTLWFADRSPSKELVAHEVVHAIQGRRGGGGGTGIAPSSSSSEAEADRLSKVLAAGEDAQVEGG